MPSGHQGSKTEKIQTPSKVLHLCYTVVPVFFVPWPFIKIKYGENEYLCWLEYNRSVYDEPVSYVIGRLLMWHFWAVLVWMFAVAMLLFAIYRYCRYKLASNGTITKPSHNVYTLLPLLLTFIIIITAHALLFIWELNTRKFSFPITVLTIFITPLTLVVYVFIVINRLLRIINFKTYAIGRNTDASLVTYNTSYGATHFILPDDEWD